MSRKVHVRCEAGEKGAVTFSRRLPLPIAIGLNSTAGIFDESKNEAGNYGKVTFLIY
jgi:hypothetical protein